MWEPNLLFIKSDVFTLTWESVWHENSLFHLVYWFIQASKRKDWQKKEKKKKIPAGEEDFFEAVLAMQKCFW